MLCYDTATKNVGRFGLYQKRVLVVIWYTMLLGGSTIVLSDVFVYYTPPHRCFISTIDESSNSSSSKLLDIPPINSSSNVTYEKDWNDLSFYIPTKESSSGDLEWSKCYRYSKQPNVNGNATVREESFNRSTIECDEGWKYFTSTGVISATMEFDFVCNEAWLPPLVASLQLAGVMFGSIGGGFLSDRFGRRCSLLASWLLLCIMSLLIAVLPFKQIYFFLWFMIGSATITRDTSGVVIINELIPEKHRHTAGFLNMAISSFGYMLLPLMNYFLPSWRIFMGVYAGLLSLAIIPIYCWVKESLNWYLRNGMHKEANALLVEIARVNKRKFDLKSEDLLLKEKRTCEHKDLQSPERQKTSHKDLQSPERQETSHKELSYVNFITVPFLRRRIAIFGMSWIATTMTYFGLSLNTNNLGSNRYIACLIAGGVEIPGNLIAYFCLRRIGGRLSFIVMTTISALCLLVTPILQNESSSAVITCSMFGKMFISGSFSILYIFTGDLFPTLLRNQAYGATSFIARWGTILVPYLLHIGVIYQPSIPYIVMGSVAILSSVGMFFLPETKNKPLPETMADAKMQESRPNKPNTDELVAEI